MKNPARALATTAALLAAAARPAIAAVDLDGSAASMRHQHGVAVEEDYTFSRTATQVHTLADEGRLEPVKATEDLALSGVSYPYARPEVHLFVERLAAQYRAANDARLVVTSLVRPRAEQPSNASPLSVHPAGMAVDLRVPADVDARRWLERTLLALEDQGVLDVTREHRPSHYHVAVFPEQYRAYAASHPFVRPAPAPKPAPAPVAPVLAAAPVAPAIVDAPSATLGLASVALLLALVFGAAAAARASRAAAPAAT